MKFGNYQIDLLFAILALTFLLTAFLLQNMAFLGAVIICLIFGVKKTGKK